MNQDFAIGAGLENRPGFLITPAQRAGIGQVAIVSNGPDAVNAFYHERLTFCMRLSRSWNNARGRSPDDRAGFQKLSLKPR